MPASIVLIDDDPAILEVYQLLLTTSGFDVTATTSGREGIDHIRKQPPDLLILDLMMPELDGMEVLSIVRSFSKIPILILSAVESPLYVESALDAGADDFMGKPAPAHLLMATINKLIRRSRGMTGNLNIERAYTRM